MGVDPLLRQSIWNHLVTLTRKERITVIVTTHYIEEARQANVVGLMRQGRLLAENSPDQLMAEYSLDTLEDVFLKLCMSDISIKAAKLSSYTSIMPKGSDFNLAPLEPNALSDKLDNNATITADQFNQITTNGDLKNIIKVMFLGSKTILLTSLSALQFPSVFSLYITNKEASYDLAPTPPSPVHHNSATPINNNSTTNLVTSEYSPASKHDHINVSTTPSYDYGMHYSSGMSSFKHESKCRVNSLHNYWNITCIVAWKNFTRLRRNIP